MDRDLIAVLLSWASGLSETYNGKTVAAVQVQTAALPAALGPQLGAASLSVVNASDGFTIKCAQLPTALGQTTMAGSVSVAIASNQSTISDNLAQVGGTAFALGQTTMAASLPVAIASNQVVPTSVATRTLAGGVGAIGQPVGYSSVVGATYGPSMPTQVENTTPTYGLAITFTPYATATTDVFTFQAGDHSVIRKIVVSGTATTAANVQCRLYSRATADTAGGATFSPLTTSVYQYQSGANATQVSKIGYWTVANPTITATGSLLFGSRQLFLGSGTTPGVPAVFDWSASGAACPEFTFGGAEFDIALDGSSNAGLSLTVEITWAELI